TGGAIKRAGGAGMNLYTLIDAEKHEWQTLVTIPIVVEVRGLESVRFRFSNSTPGDFRISQDDIEHPLELAILSADGSPQGTIGDRLLNRWREGSLPSKLGEHAGIRLTSDDSHIRTDGSLYRIDVDVDIRVDSALYFHQVPLSEIQGFKDELTGAIHTQKMTT